MSASVSPSGSLSPSASPSAAPIVYLSYGTIFSPVTTATLLCPVVDATIYSPRAVGAVVTQVTG